MLFASCKSSEDSSSTPQPKPKLELSGEGLTLVSEGVYAYNFSSDWIPGKSPTVEISANVVNATVQRISFKNLTETSRSALNLQVLKNLLEKQNTALPVQANVPQK